VPGDLADTLHNLGETLAKMGRYDQALPRYHRALELRRGAGASARSGAWPISPMASARSSMRRADGAAAVKDEAFEAYRDLKQRDVWLARTLLSGAGYNLSLAGGARRRSQRRGSAGAHARGCRTRT
jgi:tetratricopeptide (TPR) repeat protein